MGKEKRHNLTGSQRKAKKAKLAEEAAVMPVATMLPLVDQPLRAAEAATGNTQAPAPPPRQAAKRHATVDQPLVLAHMAEHLTDVRYTGVVAECAQEAFYDKGKKECIAQKTFRGYIDFDSKYYNRASGVPFYRRE